MKSYRRSARAATAFLTLLLAGCGILGVEDDLDGERERLERSVRLWSANAPPRYRFVLERLCFCGQEVTAAVEITVSNGAVVVRRYVATGHLVGSRWASLFPAMEGVFEILEDALDRKADRMDVTYDGRLGYPLRASIDYVLNAIDDELEVRVRDFAEF